VPTNVRSWWKSGRAVEITARTAFDPTAAFAPRKPLIDAKFWVDVIAAMMRA
jgi:hypothetical protein